ncbi:p21-activated protein kinase-interacting protein 1-like [Saccostrea echinata]|uniref:p21-activated protein kinase-interacting protein 1-like n=1 Tax=Saccostrea echinata TaxID=191078 RepID=UPI002A84091D|nr:p21-activated protein kinase-interacting protein 1-like [Saccostrea echinata]
MDLEVVVGTYEEILLGFRVVVVGKDFQLEPSFTDHSHSGCVKHVAVSKKGILASGGTDETIQLFNLKKRSQLGSLGHHSGSLTCLQFFKNTHLFSASEDGTLCIWKTFTWECLKTLRGHKGPVLSLSVHPSGKLALTVGQDKTLRTWNLITGKSAYITNIKRAADVVCWSPSGHFYAVVFANKVDVYKLETGSVCSSWTSEHKVNSFAFVNDSIVVYGGEGGVISLYDINNNTELASVSAEVNRIRGISAVKSDPAEEDKYYVFTASSDGFIKMFFLTLEEKKVNMKLLASHNAGFRLTCITVTAPLTSDEEKVSKVKVKTENVLEDNSALEDRVSKVKGKTENVLEDNSALGNRVSKVKGKTENVLEDNSALEDRVSKLKGKTESVLEDNSALEDRVSSEEEVKDSKPDEKKKSQKKKIEKKLKKELTRKNIKRLGKQTQQKRKGKKIKKEIEDT